MVQARILIVEDDNGGREALAELLVEEGFSVETACNGADALRKLGAVRPDLILSDVVMPDIGGLELASRVRGHAPWADIPIVLVTAWGEPRVVPDGLESLVASRVHKPIDFDGLLRRIRVVLAC